MNSVIKWSLILTVMVGLTNLCLVATNTHLAGVQPLLGFIALVIGLNAVCVIMALKGTAGEAAYGKQLGWLMSRTTERLPEWANQKRRLWSVESAWGGTVRIGAPSGGSTRTTSAPMSASSLLHSAVLGSGNSRTRTPSRLCMPGARPSPLCVGAVCMRPSVWMKDN